ncbi:DUF3052 domain-containing protein [Lentzea flava]|uniref:DUF3052 domain-containing protein n=1 Tax=Lentzea flava TaxID=103732 RepID=A0ABQ2UD56_9PSEU|nr:DUF3052 domain-containing protein [Lentzea flava]MCP2197981.1 hypothetical protein [Lentzea flava]GGU23831.1 hypothetical protein GCM10010178_15010 [Lentzea flava]
MTGRSGAGGYSGTPLAKKIGIRPGDHVRFVHRPSQWEVPDMADSCRVSEGTGGADDTDVTLAFHTSFAALATEAPGLVDDLADHAMLWIAWPRRAAGHHSDITENALRELFLPLGVVDVKVAALGDDWSGLKFVRRKENRRS